ncbi:elongation factor P [Kangiella geojedonensis]|uniref:Elongation factor P n=1 Tax=Kangiella geojedonensis TaxID=914150 RepID=A0A0F6TQ53_9GAMM|nr:elongation factor P [Kangiella geojedonensis]AKE51517.1 elongation factor P [Kangiella geojedonensis]
MGTITTNDLRNGTKLILDGEPCTVVDNQFVRPGKGQAFSKTKVLYLLTGRTVEKTFKSGESIETADVIDTDMDYIYNDGEFWYFMDPNSFEQVQADANAVGEAKNYLIEQDKCQVTLWNGSPIGVTPPNFVILEVTDTDPGLRGDTSGGGSKPATMHTGAVVKVPLFVNIGDKLKVDTRNGEYVSRA